MKCLCGGVMEYRGLLSDAAVYVCMRCDREIILPLIHEHQASLSDFEDDA